MKEFLIVRTVVTTTPVSSSSPHYTGNEIIEKVGLSSAASRRESIAERIAGPLALDGKPERKRTNSSSFNALEKKVGRRGGRK